jgi:hypothetical protein
MGNFIGIDRVNAEFVEFPEDVALAAANAARLECSGAIGFDESS